MMVCMSAPPLDHETCYRAVSGRDRRFDGVFYTAVKTTGIYCRPSCPARTPASRNVTFHPTAASAQAAGFRACKRCLPDATPGSPRWDVNADTAGRAMRLINDGVVDRAGVEELARQVGYTSRHLNRLLVAEVGAGPLALARARRAQTARVLVETTDLPLTDVAFAAGFSSVRQFNESFKEVYDAAPRELRRGFETRAGRAPQPPEAERGPHPSKAPGVTRLPIRLAVRTPYAGKALLAFLAPRTVAGVETARINPGGEGTYARTLRLPHGVGAVEVHLSDHEEVGTAQVDATLHLADLRDLGAAVERTRRLLDADADPLAVRTALESDKILGPLIAHHPGLRVPGHVDGEEIAVRAVLGQQISVARARTLAGDLTEKHGQRIETSYDDLTHLFPTSDSLSRLTPEDYPMPRARGRALISLTKALADEQIRLDRSTDRHDVREALLALPGIGPWTADYIAMRALGDPDVFLATDVGIKHALTNLGHDPTHAERLADTWRPWRSYAQIHLWQSLHDVQDQEQQEKI
jgi:AraC family transcriptional regulator of adaptative response / DNA-3-methyladenine glycosylase II